MITLTNCPLLPFTGAQHMACIVISAPWTVTLNRKYKRLLLSCFSLGCFFFFYCLLDKKKHFGTSIGT